MSTSISHNKRHRAPGPYPSRPRHAPSPIFEYSFATRQVTPLTRFTDEIAGGFGISPDGQYVVFERGAELGADVPYDVWIMRRNGTEMRRLVQNDYLSTWSPRALPAPLTPSA